LIFSQLSRGEQEFGPFPTGINSLLLTAEKAETSRQNGS
jgi:hypothetical protein